jgi:hypothetical protein
MEKIKVEKPEGNRPKKTHRNEGKLETGKTNKRNQEKTRWKVLEPSQNCKTEHVRC